MISNSFEVVMLLDPDEMVELHRGELLHQHDSAFFVRGAPAILL